MWRWLSVGLTSLVLIAGLWGVTLWWGRPQLPPLGDITLEEVTPPFGELTVRPQKYCSESAPGFWATGTSSLSVPETLAWFEDTFGPVNEEVTLRINGGQDSRRVFDDIEVFARVEAGGTYLWVQTYDTVSHDCLPWAHMQWDLRNASTFIDACDKLVIYFWGVEYGAGRASSPPADWAVIDFDGGQAIAHSIENPNIIYASDDDEREWTRYRRDTACYSD